MVKLEDTPQPQPILLLKKNGCWACPCDMETGGCELEGKVFVQASESAKGVLMRKSG